MGNEGSTQYKNTLQRRSRYRTLDNSVVAGNRSKINSSRRNQDSFNEHSIFVTPPINRSVEHRRGGFGDAGAGEEDGDGDQGRGGDSRVYESIDVNEDRRRVASTKKAERSEKDRILETLSRKNQELRRQLKQISDDLTQKLKRKKLVPKRKDAKSTDDNESQSGVKVADKQQIGLKKELDNVYKQIEMYKKIIMDLKSKQEGITAEHRANILENQIKAKNQEIEKYQQKKIALEKVRNQQATHIKQEINDDLRLGIDTYKKEAEQLHNRLKKFAKQDRAREEAYKKQQAYLCDLQRKWRQLDDSYFPQLSNKLKKDQQKTATSDKDKQINEKQFYNLAEQARLLRKKHEDYNHKIEVLLIMKNKRLEEQNDLKEQIVYKDRIIQALKIKIATIQKLLKPRKSNLFGYDSQQGSEGQAEFEDNQSQIQRQLQEELNQDQFDIKHLIANIPKPVRKRPQQISNGYSSGGSSSGPRKPGGPGMIITSEKAQPKKWGATTTRTEERGKHFKGELAFEDRAQFDLDVQPIIVGVNVWVNKNNTILGIQAIYLNNNELRYGVKSSDSAQGIIRRFDLQTPDYLKNLTFTVSREGFVESFTLYSKQGKIGKFGNKRSEDESINFGLASNERPFMFFGASSLYEAEPRLNFFGIQICSE